MAIKTVSGANFENEVIKSERTVLVDFWATWCGPCKMLAPELEKLAAAHPEIDVAKVNVDENPDLAAAYHIAAIPTLLLFKNGEVAATKVGALSKGQLKEFLDANLA